MSLQDKIRSPLKGQKQKGPIWQGPESSEDNGGITFSMLSRFLVCRERFRLLVVEGLKPVHRFNHRIHYGNMWHICEEALAQWNLAASPVTKQPMWEKGLTTYCQALVKQYPFQQEDIEKWYNVCKVQFPLYVDYWRKNKDVVERTPLLQEQVFKVPYTLPSGRTVYLRGKWDSVDLIGKGKEAGVYLQENKTKGDIDERQLARQVTYDLQTMIYLVALNLGMNDTVAGSDAWQFGPVADGYPLQGIRYNVIRRPLSGGTGTIRPHQATKNKPAETTKEYYVRLATIIQERADYFFFRLKIEVSQSEIQAFRTQTLDPILEQLCDWWDWINFCDSPGRVVRTTTGKDIVVDPFSWEWSNHIVAKPQNLHWRHPFGVYNILDEGGSSDLDEYLTTGSESGLERVNELFTELKE